MACFCIRFGFKIAGPLLSFPSMASGKGFNKGDSMFALAPPAGVPAYPMALPFSYEFDKHICCRVFFLFVFFITSKP